MHYFKVFKNVSYQTLARILTSGVGFLISILLARSFGVSGFGDYIKITSYVSLFYLLTDFGLNAIFIKEEKEGFKFKDLLYLRLIFAFCIFVIVNIIAFFLPFNKQLNLGFSEVVRFGIFIFSFTIFTQSLLFSTNAMFQKKLKFEYWTKSLGFGSLLSLSLIVLFISKGLPLYFVLLSLVLGNAAAAALSLFYAKEKLFPLSFNSKFAKSLIVKSYPLGFMLIFNLIYFRIDSLILAFYKSSDAVGIYGFSYLFFDFLLAIPLFISNSIYPILLSFKEKRNDFFKFTKPYFYIYPGISLLLILPFWFASSFFVLIKPQFGLSVVPFRILLLSLPFFFMTSFLQWILITVDKVKYLMYVYFLSMVLNIILNFIFIPKYSYVAAAAVTGVCETLVFVFLLYKFIRLKYE